MKTRESWAALAVLALMAAVIVFYWTGFSQRQGEGDADFAGHGEGPLISRVSDFTEAAEGKVNTLLDRNHLFIQLYGGVQRIAGRRVMVDTVQPAYTVVKLSDGTLTFVNENPGNPEDQRQVLLHLRDALAEREIPLCYVQAPNKLAPGDGRLPPGVREGGNTYADGILNLLSDIGVDALDLRETFLQSEKGWENWFFSTDHHWTPEGALLACGALYEKLSRDYGLSLDGEHINPALFEKTVYKDFFLGSQGKRVGSLYGGTDDFTALIPLYPTLFTYEVYSQEIGRTGSFEDALLFSERIARRDWYGANPYTYYSGGDYPMGRIYNHLNADGPRIMLLRDSYGCALAPFLALGCSELITADLRHFTKRDKLLDYVDWLEPDIVILMYSAGPLNLDKLLKF